MQLRQLNWILLKLYLKQKLLRFLNTTRRWMGEAGFLLNIIAIGISLLAVKISVNTYSSGEEASKTQEGILLKQKDALDQSREALKTVVNTAKKQQEVLEQNLAVSSAQLSILKAQWDQEMKRQKQRPRLELGLSMPSSAALLSQLKIFEYLEFDPITKSTKVKVFQKNLMNIDRIIPLLLDDTKKVKLQFLMKNMGDAPLLNPVLMSVASNGVIVDPKQRVGNLDILPFKRAGRDFSSDWTLTVPEGTDRFGVRFDVWGENMDNATLNVQFVIVSK